MQWGHHEMTPYSISAVDLRQLFGQKFNVPNLASGGSVVEFYIQNRTPGWPRTGLEAIGLLVDCDHPTRGHVPSFLKIFKADVPERLQRNNFLIKLGLAHHHEWLFTGMPYMAISKTINGVRIIGHAAQQIRGKGQVAEDFGRLRVQGRWALDRDTRTRLAGHLCCAIRALEKMDIVHGDISAGNIMIGVDGHNEPAAMLCDFDGFYKPGIAPLPQSIRPIGTMGYQYPELLYQRNSRHPDIIVKTDRFAMAVMLCELMVWPNKAEDIEDREQLLTDDMIERRSLDGVPKDLVREWPAGFDLLEHALRAQTIQNMPSPAQWLGALDVNIGPGPAKSFSGRPLIDLFRRHGSQAPRLVKQVRLDSNNGDFGKVHPKYPELQQLQFDVSNRKLKLRLGWNAPVFLRRERELYELGMAPREVEAQPEDVVISNFWELVISDDP